LEHLKAALADRYAIEREIGSGGMAVVYLARDLRLDRTVALKVLRPELAASLGVERFIREIEIAGKLNHPNILPLYDSGEADGLLYYAMPYVEGESLRDLLARITREVADALSHAHAYGVIHRDIKPENIMFQSGHAVVSDFGIARAVTEAGGEKLTQTGVAVGTPAYMSPEQAAGVGTIDARSDVYALGCLLYEMLAGEAPFTGPTAQAIMARHAMDPVPSLRTVRDTISVGVEGAITQALSKVPADRFRTATEFAEALDRGSVAGMPMPSMSARASLPLAAVGFYLVSAALVLGLSYVLVRQLGLPDWVFAGAAVLLAVGLPIVTFTAHLERRRELAQIAGRQTAAHTGVRKPFTWRRALLGGGVAFGALALVTAIYMGMRLLGIGPVGTLLAKGIISERDWVVLADFENLTADSMLGPVVTEAFRIDFSQNRLVSVADPSYVGRVLRRMRVERGTEVGVELAREVAVRQGHKAVIAGQVGALGDLYVISVRIVEAENGIELASLQQTAESAERIIGAIERVSRKLRERLGEPLKIIRANPPLEDLTTRSLEALRLYAEAVRALGDDEDDSRGVELLDEAVDLDPEFAMAWRKLGTQARRRSRRMEALATAFEQRDRLTDRERYLTEATYYFSRSDPANAINAYLRLLDAYPDDALGNNNLGVQYENQRDYAVAERYYAHAAQLDPAIEPTAVYAAMLGLVRVQFAQGKFEEARVSLARDSAARPGHPDVQTAAIRWAASRFDHATALARAQSLLEERRESVGGRVGVQYTLFSLHLTLGQLAEARRYAEAAIADAETLGIPHIALRGVVLMASATARVERNPDAALREAEDALRRYPMESMRPADRPYLFLAGLYSTAGRPDRARAVLQEYEALVPAESQRFDQGWIREEWGQVAFAEGRYADAIAEYRLADQAARNPVSRIKRLGLAYEAAGQTDSAIGAYERYVTMPWYGNARGDNDAYFLALHLERLGMLYEERGDREKALLYYGRFVDLWQNADPELQWRVEDARRRMAELVAEPR
jgi:tetratricopeptide (TPR) repeat protein